VRASRGRCPGARVPPGSRRPVVHPRASVRGCPACRPARRWSATGCSSRGTGCPQPAAPAEATRPGAAAAPCRTARTGSAPAPGSGRYRPVAAPTTSGLPSLRRSTRGGVPLTDSRLQERVHFVPAGEVVLSDDATVSVQFAVRVRGRVIHVVDQEVDLILVDGVLGRRLRFGIARRDGDRTEALPGRP